MWPEIYVHPLSPAVAEALQIYWEARHSAWSQTRFQIQGPPALIISARHIQRLSEAIPAAKQALPAQAEDRATRAAPSQAGRLIVELILAAPSQLQITVTRTCSSPTALASEQALLAEIQRIWPEAHTRHAPPARRGGPAGTPENQRLQIVRGWLDVQGRMNQEVYAGSQGIAVSTLRRWMRAFQEAHKL